MKSLTKLFSETVRENIERDPEFRRAYLREGMTCFLNGEVEVGKSVLRQYINGTVGFVKLGADLGKSPKTLMRMFSASGNPQARNLFDVISYLQKIDGTRFEVVDRAA
jgi:DNA-binding phage protein